MIVFKEINVLHVNQRVDQQKVGQPNVGQQNVGQHREVNLMLCNVKWINE